MEGMGVKGVGVDFDRGPDPDALNFQHPTS